MIPLLPKWNLHGNRPTFYDADAVTMLELASILHGSMNTVIDEYNKLAESVNKTITDFTTGAIKDREEFETALRQEFQDFIDIVNLKNEDMDRRIKNIENNVVTITTNLVSDAIRNNRISIVEDYDPETESLNMVINGGV